MFAKKNKVIIYVGLCVIKAVKYALKKGKYVLVRQIELNYKDDLADQLKKLKKKFNFRQVRLLLSEKDTYLRLIDFPADVKLTRKVIFDKVKESIVEGIEDRYFDWKIVRRTKSEQRVQCLAVDKKYLDKIRKSFQEAQIKIIAFEPPSFGLARLVRREKKPGVVVSQLNEHFVIAAVDRGKVLESMIVENKSEIKGKVAELIDFVKSKWGIGLQEANKKKLSAFLGLAIKKDLKGRDKDVLNLSPPEIEVSDEISGERGIGARKIFLFLMMTVLVSVGIFGVLYFLLLNRPVKDLDVNVSLDDVQPTSSPAVEETVTPTSVSNQELKRDDISVKVLNGSGAVGAAGDAQAYLEDLGYENVDTGNADSYDYEKTIIKIKKDKQDYVNLLKKDLKERYTINKEIEELEENNDFDAVLIIGPLL